VEFAIEGRRIDILAKDMAGVPVIVELKVSRGHERTIGRCLYYRTKIKEIMNAAKVRLIVVAQEISPELKLAAQEVPDVTLFEYTLSMTVRR
jgi:endonuclease